jgi:hypothetical protein
LYSDSKPESIDEEIDTNGYKPASEMENPEYELEYIGLQYWNGTKY